MKGRRSRCQPQRLESLALRKAVAPAGTPAAIVTRLNAEMRKIIDDPKVKAQIANIGFEAFSSTPEQLGEFVKAQLAKSAKMIKDAGIEPE